MQKPISVDVVEGQAMLAAARKHKRVVQVGTQRRSTPHLIEARDTHHPRGQAGQGRAGGDLLLLRHAAADQDPPETAPPAYLDYEMWTGPAPMRPVQPRHASAGLAAFMEYGNGIIGDMCIHMFDMARWMLDLGWPKRISSSGGILVNDGQQGEHPRHADAPPSITAMSRSSGSTATGAAGAGPEVSRGARRFYGDKGTLKASVNSYDFTPVGPGQLRSTRT